MNELPENKLFITLYVAALIGAFSLFGALLASRAGLLYALLGLMAGGTLGSLVVASDASILGSLRGGLLALPLALVAAWFFGWDTAILVIFAGYTGGAILGYLLGQSSGESRGSPGDPPTSNPPLPEADPAMSGRPNQPPAENP